jgi:ABC-type antimicrobial peptide transport system permease subunit
LRIALGAQRKNIHFAVLRESAYLTGIGIATGLLASFVVTRSLSATLYGVTTHDPLTFSLVLLLLLAGSLFASLIPAYRAASVEPMQALRSE